MNFAHNGLQFVSATYRDVEQLPTTYQNVQTTLNNENLSASDRAVCLTLQTLPTIRLLDSNLAAILPCASVVNLASLAATCYVARDGHFEQEDLQELAARYSFIQWDFHSALSFKMNALMIKADKERIQKELLAKERELISFAQWLSRRPDDWKWQYLCRIAAGVNRLEIFSRPYKIPTTHAIFSQTNLQAFFRVFRIDWATLKYFKDNRRSRLDFDQNHSISFDDFVPIDAFELQELRFKLQILFNKFKLDQSADRLKTTFADPSFANWVWATSDENRRRRYFCPFSGNFLLSPIRLGAHLHAEAEGLHALRRNEIETVNGNDTYYMGVEDLSHKNSLITEYAQLWQQFIDSPPRLPPQRAIAANRYLGVHKKYYDRSFWDWVWMQFPEHRSRYFCIVSNELILNPVVVNQMGRTIELKALKKIVDEGYREANLSPESEPPAWISLTAIDRANCLEEQQILLHEYQLLWERWQQVRNGQLNTPVNVRVKTYYAQDVDLKDPTFLSWLRQNCTVLQRLRYFCPVTGELIKYPITNSWFSIETTLALRRTAAQLFGSQSVEPFDIDIEKFRLLKTEYREHWETFVRSTRANKFR